MVWPGSSRAFERLAATDPERFRMMIDLGGAREEAGVGVDGAAAPIELRHRQGDVLFYVMVKENLVRTGPLNKTWLSLPINAPNCRRTSL